MRERNIHGLCRGKQSAWLSANRTKSGSTRNPCDEVATRFAKRNEHHNGTCAVISRCRKATYHISQREIYH